MCSKWFPGLLIHLSCGCGDSSSLTGQLLKQADDFAMFMKRSLLERSHW